MRYVKKDSGNHRMTLDIASNAKTPLAAKDVSTDLIRRSFIRTHALSASQTSSCGMEFAGRDAVRKVTVTLDCMMIATESAIHWLELVHLATWTVTAKRISQV